MNEVFEVHPLSDFCIICLEIVVHLDVSETESDEFKRLLDKLYELSSEFGIEDEINELRCLASRGDNVGLKLARRILTSYIYPEQLDEKIFLT